MNNNTKHQFKINGKLYEADSLKKALMTYVTDLFMAVAENTTGDMCQVSIDFGLNVEHKKPVIRLVGDWVTLPKSSADVSPIEAVTKEIGDSAFDTIELALYGNGAVYPDAEVYDNMVKCHDHPNAPKSCSDCNEINDKQY